MIDSIYIGLTGLSGYSKGLTNISNNVANLNSPGYKGRQLLFSDLFYSFDPGASGDRNASPFAQGSGMRAGNEHINFLQGDFRSTGSDLDVAVDGNGFLIIRRGEETYYTRSGQLEVNEAGDVVARGSTDLVQFLRGDGTRSVNVNASRSYAREITKKVVFTDDANSGIAVNATFDITGGATVIDSEGTTRNLTITFTKVANDATKPTVGTTFQVAVKEGSTVYTGTPSPKLEYDLNGKVMTGQDRFTLTFTPAGAGPQTVEFDFSKTEAFSQASATMKMESQDGVSVGSLTRMSFNEKGEIQYAYSNGKTVTGPRLALASFNHLSGLEPVGDNLFANSDNQDVILGGPGDSLFGSIRGGGVEASNVDLAQQFSELIITQRGYQAASQIITAANEMIQQLLEMRGRR